MYAECGRLVLERWPVRDKADAQGDWEILKQQLPVGQSVTGTVIAKAPFGAWLDIGVGFPALLLIPNVEGLTPERYRNDQWCPVGSTVRADVGWFDDGKFKSGCGKSSLCTAKENRSCP